MELYEKPSNDGDALLEIVSKIKGNKEAFDFYKEAQISIAALEASSFDARNALADLSCIEHMDEVSDTEEHISLKIKWKNILERNDTVKRAFNRRFKSLVGDLLNTPNKVDDIDYQFDKIADKETVRNFKHYYDLFCMYRYEFAKRSKDINEYLLFIYKDEHETHRAYDAVNLSMNEDKPITFTFNLYRHRPYGQALRDLDAFQDNVKACMGVFYHMYKCIGGADVMYSDVVRDAKDRITERERPSQLFKRWERCLLAYDIKDNTNLKLADIARKCSESIRVESKILREFSNDADAASAAKKDIAEAIRLIESVSKGTFPY